MSVEAPILIYCRWETAGGIERVSLRLRDFLRRNGVPAELISRDGGPVFGQEVLRLSQTDLRGRTMVVSRKRDLLNLGRRALGLRLVYWRHVPVVGRLGRQLTERAFVAYMSWRAPVVCVCDELAHDIRHSPGVRRSAVQTIYAPVAADLPSDVPIRLSSAPRRLVHVGRPGGQKRLDKVLAAVSDARAGGLPVTLQVHGYPQPDRSPEGVTFAPLDSDPRASFAQADALVVWSEFEGFPTVMVEAAIAGLPIIANAFSTGLADFERLIGPTARIRDEPHALRQVFTRMPSGQYDLSGVRDEALWAAWSKALGVPQRAECCKSDISDRESAGLRVSDV